MNLVTRLTRHDLLVQHSFRRVVSAGPLSALYKDINVVHPSLLSCLEPLENQQVRELLKKLGVHELEPQELLEQHIYPTIRNNKWKVEHTQLQHQKKKSHGFISCSFGLRCLSGSLLPLIPTPVKAWIGGCELPGFHQAALLQPRLRRRRSSRPHLQGSALPGHRKGPLLWRVQQHQPAKETTW